MSRQRAQREGAPRLAREQEREGGEQKRWPWNSQPHCTSWLPPQGPQGGENLQWHQTWEEPDLNKNFANPSGYLGRSSLSLEVCKSGLHTHLSGRASRERFAPVGHLPCKVRGHSSNRASLFVAAQTHT